MGLTHHRDCTRYDLTRLVGEREKKECAVLQGKIAQIENDPKDSELPAKPNEVKRDRA